MGCGASTSNTVGSKSPKKISKVLTKSSSPNKVQNSHSPKKS